MRIEVDNHSTLLSRNPDGLDHHPLHLLHTDQSLQEDAKLRRSQLHEIEHLGEIFWRQGSLVRLLRLPLFLFETH